MNNKNKNNKTQRSKTPTSPNLPPFITDFTPVNNNRPVVSLDIFLQATKEERNEIWCDFLFLLRRFLMQPPIREFYIRKSHPSHTEYYMMKMEYDDDDVLRKIQTTFIKDKIKEMKALDEKTPKILLLDFAEQLTENGGGHYTSYYSDGSHQYYMDSDPFYYGNENQKNKGFHRIFSNIPNPPFIYGDENHDKTSSLKHRRSIQNLHKYDVFCQSWSLYFLTRSSPPTYRDISRRLRFQETTAVLHEDEENTLLNFPAFLENFLFLIDFWKELLNMNKGEQLEKEVLLHSQFSLWNTKDMIRLLDLLRTYVLTLQKRLPRRGRTNENTYIQQIVALQTEYTNTIGLYDKDYIYKTYFTKGGIERKNRRTERWKGGRNERHHNDFHMIMARVFDTLEELEDTNNISIVNIKMVYKQIAILQKGISSHTFNPTEDESNVLNNCIEVFNGIIKFIIDHIKLLDHPKNYKITLYKLVNDDKYNIIDDTNRKCINDMIRVNNSVHIKPTITKLTKYTS